MMSRTLSKLLAAWFLISILSLGLATYCLRQEVPELTGMVIFELGLLLAAASGCGFALTYVLARRWMSRVKRLESFARDFPAVSSDLPDNGPAELRELSRGMRRMADEVRRIIDTASLESSRRETILAGMAEGVLAVDRNLNVVFCNDAFADAFNTRTPISEGRPLYEVVREPALRDILQLVASTGQAQKDRFQLPTAAGRWFEAHALPLGRELYRGSIVVLHDITDIQRQEQARKDFVANVSHELRTPLAAIRGYAETLLDGALEDKANNRKFVDIIHSHAIRLNNIASDLLILSELDSKTAPSEPDCVQVLDIVQSALRTVESNATSRSVHLNAANCSPCLVTGYRFRLEQALTNLLDNAVKFNRPEGEVIVECGYAEKSQVCISVADTGIGIPSEDLKRVFERFYRVDKARSRSAGGTGLGLPIVREIVERMGGTISVESQLGRGTRFTILLSAN